MTHHKTEHHSLSINNGNGKHYLGSIEENSDIKKNDIVIEQEPEVTLNYGIHENPPLTITVLTALQHIVICFSGALSTAMVVADCACVPYNSPLRSQIFCTTIAMSGLATVMQTYLGIRLPTFQGASASFLVPLLAIQRHPEFKCVSDIEEVGATSNTTWMSTNTSNVPEGGVSEEGQYWRLQNMSGALVIASIVEISFGLFGLLNIVLRFIGPITVGVTITLIGTTLSRLPIIYGKASYSMSFFCLALIVIFVVYLKNVGLPLPKCGKGSDKRHRKYFNIFQLLPILIAIIITWGVSAILTAVDYFPDDVNDVSFMARADAKLDVITRSPWFQVVYPGQYGPPRVNLALTIGFMVAFVASMLESVGDYHATRVACQVAPPPDYAISRGILVEGLSSLLSGFCGAGHATTSYSGNIAILTITKTASRSVMYVAGFMLVLTSLVGKAGAVFSAVPDPILGGVMMVLVGTLISIGVAALSDVDMTSSRNLIVVGVPLMAGITVPAILEKYPGLIATGSVDADRILTVMAETPMFLGGVIAMILDSTAPGTLASRGMAASPSKSADLEDDHSAQNKIYAWGSYPRVVRALPWLSYLPFMPGRNAFKHLQRQVTQEEALLEHTSDNLEHTSDTLEHTSDNLEHTSDNLEHTSDNLEHTRDNGTTDSSK